jgi:hypothetical protein
MDTLAACLSAYLSNSSVTLVRAFIYRPAAFALVARLILGTKDNLAKPLNVFSGMILG